MDNQQTPSSNVNHSIDARRTARDGDRLTNFAMATIRPFIEFHSACWRQYASNCEQIARNFDNAVGMIAGNTPTEQQQPH